MVGALEPPTGMPVAEPVGFAMGDPPRY